jgi:hypothetical protein
MLSRRSDRGTADYRLPAVHGMLLIPISRTLDTRVSDVGPWAGFAGWPEDRYRQLRLLGIRLVEAEPEEEQLGRDSKPGLPRTR